MIFRLLDLEVFRLILRDLNFSDRCWSFDSNQSLFRRFYIHLLERHFDLVGQNLFELLDLFWSFRELKFFLLHLMPLLPQILSQLLMILDEKAKSRGAGIQLVQTELWIENLEKLH